MTTRDKETERHAVAKAMAGEAGPFTVFVGGEGGEQVTFQMIDGKNWQLVFGS